MAPIGIALIGGGIFIREEHLPAVLAIPELLTIKAIFSRSLKSAQETSKLVTDSLPAVDLYSADAGVGKTYEDLLARDDITAIIIGLSILAQPAYIRLALDAGKHVFSEKPVAPDVYGALQLIKHYRSLRAAASPSSPPVSAPSGSTEGEGGQDIFEAPTWGIAENLRFYEAYQFAAGAVQSKLGKITGFVVRLFMMIKPDNKFIETEWRKAPEHQGGFLLDAGVHFAAVLRLLLGKDSIEHLAAFSTLLLPYLPPVDTVHASMVTKSGVVGSWVFTFGSPNYNSYEFLIIGENGTVTATDTKVTVSAGGESEVTDFAATSGVKEEVRAWAEALSSGKSNLRLEPEEGLADLELIQAMLESGDQKGLRQTLTYQEVFV